LLAQVLSVEEPEVRRNATHQGDEHSFTLVTASVNVSAAENLVIPANVLELLKYAFRFLRDCLKSRLFPSNHSDTLMVLPLQVSFQQPKHRFDGSFACKKLSKCWIIGSKTAWIDFCEGHAHIVII
jgi:hypothetical protein